VKCFSAFGHKQVGGLHAEEVALSSDQPDGELISGSRAEPVMFAEIFHRYHSELYRYLRRRVGGQLAGDLAAETFVTAFARRGAYRPESPNARPWLYGIAHNLLRNHLRQEQRQLAAYARHGAGPLADVGAAAEFSAADSRADAAAVRSQLAQLLAAMPVGDRDVLLLLAWADMTYPEVAQALGIPVGTVGSRLNRARRQLRPLLDGGDLNLLGGHHG
jgi:RNA polymerase sigma factor (sigma-70 family)